VVVGVAAGVEAETATVAVDEGINGVVTLTATATDESLANEDFGTSTPMAFNFAINSGSRTPRGGRTHIHEQIQHIDMPVIRLQRQGTL